MRRDIDSLRAQLAGIDREHRRRTCEAMTRSPTLGAAQLRGPGGQLWINFCSNDYLGLSQHPDVVAACREAVSLQGVGSGAAHLLGGHSAEHRALELELAEWTGRERALLFGSGYLANLAVIPAFAARGETVLEDRLNHASLLDAARLSDARLLRYPHADAEAAARLLGNTPSACLLATDGVFSMDGDVAPLRALAEACLTHHAWLLVDDAHGLGVLGEGGRGSLAEAGLTAREVPLLMGTLGKALGTYGAFVAGDDETIELLLQKARTYLFTTAAPPAIAAATRVALHLARDDASLRMRLQANIRHFREAAARHALPLSASATAIQPLIVGAAAAASWLGGALRERGFLVGVTRPPTVPAGTSRLRITLSAAHAPEQIDALVGALRDALAALPPTLSEPGDAAAR